MHVQTLASGSAGNATLVRAGDLLVLVDAGLPWDDLLARFEEARVAPRRIDHVLVTHGHLDHARSAGRLGRVTGARIHCSEGVAHNAALRRAPRMAILPRHAPFPLRRDGGEDADEVRALAVELPHDAAPTYAFALEHGGRRTVILTDLGRPDPGALAPLAGAHLLVLEFNHDAGLLRSGPYPAALKRRVGGPRGHLSNEEACAALRRLAGPELRTLVLAHLSRTNNTPELAREAARRTLDELGLAHVRVVVAEQDEPGPNLPV